MGPLGPDPFVGPGYRRPLNDARRHLSPIRLRVAPAVPHGAHWRTRRRCAAAPLIIDATRPAERIIKFTRETADANHVAAWRQGGVRIGEDWIRTHFIVSSDRIIRDWHPPAPEDLSPGDLEPALTPEPDIVILGTGETLLRPKLDLMALMAERGIGLEIMDTPAACRTYNVLLHEGRSVVAALFMP